MKIFYAFLFFLQSLLLIPSISETTLPNPRQYNELQNIDEEIESLEIELNKMRKDALNQEIHAQPYMIDNWKEFARDIQRNEINEKKILEIKKKIKELSERKQILLKHFNC